MNIRNDIVKVGAPARSIQLLCLWLCLICPGGVALADAAEGIGLKPDLRLLVDTSGNMLEPDAENQLADALNLMLRLLPDGARAGIWGFSAEVAELVPHREVDAQWRKAAGEALAAMAKSGVRTNIPAALAAAAWDLEQLEPGYRTSIVLLSDGGVDVSESPMVNASASRSVLGRMAPKLGESGIPVHTIAVSDEADWAFLSSLARTTGGIAEKADSVGQLSGILLQALEMVAPRNRVPVVDGAFQIDESVRKFTALIFFGGHDTRVALLGPTEIVFQPRKSPAGVEWLHKPQYTLVTVGAPRPGSWQLEAPGLASAWVTVKSDLELEVEPPPGNLTVGQPAELGLRLRERGGPLADPAELELLEIAVEVVGPRDDRVDIDVSASYPAPADGEYRVALPPFEEPGRYRLVARLNGQTVQRELPMYIEVEGTSDKSTLTTRGREVPEQDLWAPLLALAAAMAVTLSVVWLILRRRKRRRLELWERRARQSGASAAAESGRDGTAGPPDASAP